MIVIFMMVQHITFQKFSQAHFFGDIFYLCVCKLLLKFLLQNYEFIVINVCWAMDFFFKEIKILSLLVRLSEKNMIGICTMWI